MGGRIWKHQIFIFQSTMHKKVIAQLAGAVEYTDWFSAEG